jgi:hypothetical protein
MSKRRFNAIIDAACRSIRSGTDLDEALTQVIEAVQADPTVDRASLRRMNKAILTGEYNGGDNIPARIWVKKVKRLAARLEAASYSDDDGAA